MKTASITDYGTIDALTIEDAPTPRPQPDEALVAVVASTINPVDVRFRTPDTIQEVARFPATLGWDMSGVVITAPDTSSWRPGDRVVAMRPPATDGTGCWAQYVAVPVAHLVRAPQTVDMPTAATLPLAGLTADQALARLDPRPGEHLLIVGAAGAVGGMAVQLASARGVTVTGLVSRPEHRDEPLRLGAKHGVDDRSTLGAFDAILDTVGLLDRPSLLREGGRLVTVSDDEIPAELSGRALRAEHNYVTHDPARLADLARMVDTGRLTLRTAVRFALYDIREAHRTFEARGQLGKVVLLT